MAIDDPINDDEDSDQGKPKKKSGIGKILLIVFLLVFLVGASVGGTLFMTGALGGDAGMMAGKDGDGSSGKKSHKGDKKAKAVYVKLGDPFVVNFLEGSQMHYLQVKIEAMTRDPVVPEAIETHLPQIRNNLVMLFSGLDYATLSTVAGKQKIRDEALAEIQAVLDQETGDPGVDAVYFTSFVMQ